MSELKYGAWYFKKKVSANRLGLVVQLSRRVASPLEIMSVCPYDFQYVYISLFVTVSFWLSSRAGHKKFDRFWQQPVNSWQ